MSKSKINYSNQFNLFCKNLKEYPFFLLCDHSFVESHIMNRLRKSLIGKAEILVFKKSLIIKGLKILCSNGTLKKNLAIKRNLKCQSFKRFKPYTPEELNISTHQSDEEDIEKYKKIIPILKSSNCIVFSYVDPFDLIRIINKHKSFVRVYTGQISPQDVWVEAGLTWLDPRQTEYFSLFNIGTKITKGRIEILWRVKILQKGEIVSEYCKRLLDKLWIFPFERKLKVKWIYYYGWVLRGKMLKYNDRYLLNKFEKGVKNIGALSVETGIPTEMSIASIILKTFTNLLVISYETEYEMRGGEILLGNLEKFKGLLGVKEIENVENEEIVEEIPYNEIQELPFSLGDLSFEIEP